MVLTDCQKLYILDSGAILGTAGDDDIRKLLKLLNKASTPSELPSKKKLAGTKTDFKGILVFPGGEVFIIQVARPEGLEEAVTEWTGYVCEIKDTMCAVGSGAQVAYGAMEAGKTASEAVEIACRRDPFSALPVQTKKLVNS
jgi:hypothetical protein